MVKINGGERTVHNLDGIRIPWDFGDDSNEPDSETGNVPIPKNETDHSTPILTWPKLSEIGRFDNDDDSDDSNTQYYREWSDSDDWSDTSEDLWDFI